FHSVTLTKRIRIILHRNIAFRFGDLQKKYSKKTVGTFRNTFPIALPVTIVFAEMRFDAFGNIGIGNELQELVLRQTGDLIPLLDLRNEVLQATLIQACLSEALKQQPGQGQFGSLNGDFVAILIIFIMEPAFIEVLASVGFQILSVLPLLDTAIDHLLEYQVVEMELGQMIVGYNLSRCAIIIIDGPILSNQEYLQTLCILRRIQNN
ncbi:MAG: hypothetical protein IJE61_07695, partial [Bacteroidales bacterium]|nr:hypothetical protein [Bacteroidales bacterium]